MIRKTFPLYEKKYNFSQFTDITIFKTKWYSGGSKWEQLTQKKIALLIPTFTLFSKVVFIFLVGEAKFQIFVLYGYKISCPYSYPNIWFILLVTNFWKRFKFFLLCSSFFYVIWHRYKRYLEDLKIILLFRSIFYLFKI